ncbi:MAG: heme A synthase [Actinomycetota bacterium]|nr:MAG: heme A synthase [Actinomycetota bacterium]
MTASDVRPRTAPVVVGPVTAAVRWIFVANLVAQIAIVVTGGVVRLTGSGLGCPTWPACVEGSYVPTNRPEVGWHEYIEFGNRTLTFVLGLLALAAIAGVAVDARRRRRAGLPARPALIALACAPLLGSVAQAVLGGIVVLTGLHPTLVAMHLLVSMVIVAACAVLVQRAGEPGDRPVVVVVVPAVRWLVRATVVVAAVVVVLGTAVTGSGPHSGDDAAEHRFSFDPRTVAWLHADLVLLLVGLTIGVLVAAYALGGPAPLRRRAWLLAAALLANGAIGYTQYFTGLPWALVACHLLGASLVWLCVVRLTLATRTRGVRSA